MLHRVRSYLAKLRYGNVKDEDRRFELTSEQVDFVSHLVAAGTAAIQNEVQVHSLIDSRKNPARLVLNLTEDPALYCWNAYSVKPQLKKEHDLLKLRRFIELRLEDQAKQDDESIEKLSTSTSWSDVSKIKASD